MTETSLKLKVDRLKFLNQVKPTRTSQLSDREKKGKLIFKGGNLKKLDGI